MKTGDRLLLGLVPPLAAGVMRLLALTVRREVLGEKNLRDLWARGERAIIAFWHDQLLLMVFGYPGKGAKLLISESQDGELLARAMGYFSQDTVRGSSSKGGRAAFREMLKLCRTDVDLVLTPDGPKGPRHTIKDGVVQLARLGRRPVVPMAFACNKGYRFSSWDRFLLPAPFSRGVYSFGKPLYYGESLDADQFRDQLHEAMLENQRAAEAGLERHGLSAV